MPDVRTPTRLRTPTSGLLASVGTITESNEVRWGRGVEWVSWYLPSASGSVSAIATKCGQSGFTYDVDDRAPRVDAYPFGVLVVDWCTSLGSDDADRADRARTMLDAYQGYLIAREFWNGAIGKSDGTAVVVGTGVTGTNFTGQTATFQLTVDGRGPITITLNANYTNAAGVVTAINTQFGGGINPATQNAGVISITSPTLGSGGLVTIAGYTQGTVSTGLGNASVVGGPAGSNTWLAKPGSTVVTGAAVSPLRAMAALDATIASVLRDGPGMIHMDVEVLGRLADSPALRRDGDRWVTPFGNRVVADGGYSGTKDGAAGGTRWMFATTPVEIVLGPISVVGTVDFRINDVLAAASRDVIVYHEPEVLHAAAQVDMT